MAAEEIVVHDRKGELVGVAHVEQVLLDETGEPTFDRTRLILSDELRERVEDANHLYKQLRIDPTPERVRSTLSSQAEELERYRATWPALVLGLCIMSAMPLVFTFASDMTASGAALIQTATGALFGVVAIGFWRGDSARTDEV